MQSFALVLWLGLPAAHAGAAVPSTRSPAFIPPDKDRGEKPHVVRRRSVPPAPKTRAFLHYHVMSPGVATRDWWAVRGALRGERDEAAVCERTFFKIKSGRSIIASPWTEPRWRSPTAPRWSAWPARRSPPRCHPGWWLWRQRGRVRATAGSGLDSQWAASQRRQAHLWSAPWTPAPVWWLCQRSSCPARPSAACSSPCEDKQWDTVSGLGPELGPRLRPREHVAQAWGKLWLACHDWFQNLVTNFIREKKIFSGT